MEAILLVAGAILGVVADRAADRLSFYWTTMRPAGHLWAWVKNSQSPLEIVVSTCPNRDSTEYTDTIYPQEAHAAAEVESYLKGAIRTDVKLVLSARPSEAIRHNLVVIGGPKHNDVTQCLLSRLDIRFHFDGHTLVRYSDGWRWNPDVRRIDGRDWSIEDFAVVVRAPNPFDRKKTVLLIAGCRTHGCLAGARAMIGENVRSTLAAIRRLGDSYALVVRVNAREDVLGAPEIVEAVSLET